MEIHQKIVKSENCEKRREIDEEERHRLKRKKICEKSRKRRGKEKENKKKNENQNNDERKDKNPKIPKLEAKMSSKTRINFSVR